MLKIIFLRFVTNYKTFLKYLDYRHLDKLHVESLIQLFLEK